VATQSPRLQRGLDPALKSIRCANYLATLRFELLALARSCRQVHPAFVPSSAIELLDPDLRSIRLDELLGYEPGWGTPNAAAVAAITELMTS
jgi:hypothetical protein